MSSTILQQSHIEVHPQSLSHNPQVSQQPSTLDTERLRGSPLGSSPIELLPTYGDMSAPVAAVEADFDTNAGWSVVLSGAVQFFVYLGLIYSYGIIQLHLVSQKLSSVATISFIGSTAACVGPLIGILVVKLMGRIGYRWTSMIGAILVGIGEFTAGFATKSVPGMFFTQSIVFGVGIALLFFPAATLPSLWFKRKRGIATGIVYGGAGLGSAVLAITLEKLIETRGLETALKVMGAVAWTLCIPASYFQRPPPGHSRPVVRIQWRLFRSVRFWCLMLMSAVAVFPLFVPPFLLPLYITSIGFSNQTGAAILSAWNLGFNAWQSGMLFSLIMIGITAMGLWPFVTSLGLLIFFAILNGACSGGFFSLVPVVVGAVLGDGQLASTMSTITTSWTFGYFLGAPIAGYLLEAYGGQDHGIEAFRPAFFYAGSITLASAGMVLAVKLMMNRNVFARV